MGFRTMNKILVIAAVAVLVVAGGIGIYLLTKDNGDSKDPERGGSDYSLLDPKNVKEGITITYSGTPYYGEFEESIVIDKVTEGNVDYTGKVYSKEYDYSKHYQGLETFTPDRFEFDYTSVCPQTVTVVRDNDTYTLNGSFASNPIVGYKYTYTYTNLKITYGTEVTGVSGIWDRVYDHDGLVLDTTYDFKTENGILMSKTTTDLVEKDTVTIEQFYDGYGPIMYDPDDYEGATITSSEGSYDGLKVTVYTMNGKVIEDYRELNYDNYKVYVYKRYVLWSVGKINGSNEDIKMTINVA